MSFIKNQQIKLIRNRLIFTQLVRTTNEDNITLRVRHLSPQLTPELRNAVIENDQPVVLAHGIHSNLDSWKSLGIELAQSNLIKIEENCS